MTVLKIILISILVIVSGCDPQKSNHPNPPPEKKIPNNKTWINGWHATSELTIQRAGMATVVANGYMYVIGGIDGSQFIPTVEYSQIMNDGSLSPWQLTSPLNEDRGFIDAVVSHGYIYVVGGGNGPNGKHLLQSVERAKLMPDGSLGAWETEKNGLITPRRCSKIVFEGDYIYALGGFAGALLDTVEKARIDKDGHVGEWNIETETMTMPRYVNSVKASKGFTYMIGGHDQNKGVGITDVEWSKPSANGEMKNWQATSALQVGRYGLSSAKHGNRVYAIGGLTGLEYLDSIETAEVTSTGGLGPWRFTTPMFEARATFSAIVYNDWMYIIGGTNQDRYLKTIEFAQINEQGNPGFWGSKQQATTYQQRQTSLKNKKTILPNEGIVQHVQYASMYTYANVKSNLGDIWLAGPKTQLNPGDTIGFSKGVSMSNFYSKELQQQFNKILFVSKIEKK